MKVSKIDEDCICLKFPNNHKINLRIIKEDESIELSFEDDDDLCIIKSELEIQNLIEKLVIAKGIISTHKKLDAQIDDFNFSEPPPF